MFKKIEDTMQPVGDSLQNAGASAAEFLKDPTVLSMLLGGAGTGIAGGYLSSRSKGPEGEDKSKRRKRILGNALLAAGAGAGIAGLGHTAYSNLKTALPKDDVDPATSILEPLLRVGAVGGTGAYLHNRGAGLENNAQGTILRALKRKLESVSGADGLKDQLNTALDERSPAATKDTFFDLHERHTRGDLKNIPGLFDDKHTVSRAGGLNSYEPADANFWANKDAWKGKDTNIEDLFKGTAPGRFTRRLLGGLGGGKIGAGVSAAALGAAAFTPEILSLIARGITGHE